MPGYEKFAILDIMKNPLDAFISSDDERLNQQLRFIAEIDKMTHILRRTLLVDGSRRENDAEHSWHLAMMALLLGEYAQDTPDTGRAIKMVILHDLIEIYAGDTFAYDDAGNKTKAERETASADKLFSQLPEDQGQPLRTLWEEFDAMKTADSRFANCLDRLQPFLHNTLTEGHTWKEGHVTVQNVLDRMDIVRNNMPRIWPWIQSNIDNAVQQGWLQK